MRSLFIFFCLNVSFCYSNDSCQDRVNIIFKNIISSIGNNFPTPPKLAFSNTVNNPAWISPSKNTIYIEKKLINFLCDDDNFTDKIAYIISHEVAHHYLNHGWMKDVDFSYSSTIGDYIYDQSYSVDQRKNDEIQADNFGGFYSKIAGYNSLDYGSEVLSQVYQFYGLKHEIKGYPSLNERTEIVNSNINRTEELAKIFEFGNIALITENYYEAQSCLNHILNSNFNSREIYNNLGVIYLLQAIKGSNEIISKFSYPIFLEQTSRAKNLSRSGSITTTKDLLIKSKSFFELSISKDNDYKKPYVNLLIADLILEKLNSTLDKNFITNRTDFLNKIDAIYINDLMILNFLLLDKSPPKKISKNISDLSKFNLNLNNSKDLVEYQFPKFELDQSKWVWLQKPYSNYRISKLEIKEKNFDNYRLIQFGERNIVEVYDEEYLNLIHIYKADNKSFINKVMMVNNTKYEINNNNSIVLKYDNNNTLKSVILYNF